MSRLLYGNNSIIFLLKDFYGNSLLERIESTSFCVMSTTFIWWLQHYRDTLLVALTLNCQSRILAYSGTVILSTGKLGLELQM